MIHIHQSHTYITHVELNPTPLLLLEGMGMMACSPVLLFMVILVSWLEILCSSWVSRWHIFFMFAFYGKMDSKETRFKNQTDGLMVPKLIFSTPLVNQPLGFSCIQKLWKSCKFSKFECRNSYIDVFFLGGFLFHQHGSVKKEGVSWIIVVVIQYINLSNATPFSSILPRKKLPSVSFGWIRGREGVGVGKWDPAFWGWNLSIPGWFSNVAGEEVWQRCRLELKLPWFFVGLGGVSGFSGFRFCSFFETGISYGIWDGHVPKLGINGVCEWSERIGMTACFPYYNFLSGTGLLKKC